jgi:hypothetical protein
MRMAEYLNKELFLQSMGLLGDETKYGNRDGEHQSRSYGTWMGYEIMGSVEDSIVEEDVAEVVHAEWLDGYDVYGGKKKYESIDCSNCGDYFKIESHDQEYWKKRFKVCPFCGAVMDGERKEGE